MLFRFQIPGLGNFTVGASSKEEAIRTMQAEIVRRGFPLDVTELIQALDAGVEVPQSSAGDFFLNPPNTPGRAEEIRDEREGFVDDQGDVGLQDLFDQGFTDASGTQGGVLPPLIDREATFPQASFRDFLRGRGVQPGGVGGTVAQGQFAPAATAFANLNELGLVPEGTSFQDFLGGGPLGSQRFAGAARQALDAAALPGDFQVLDPQGGTFTSAAENLLNLVRLAERGGRPFSSGIFTPSNAQIERRTQDVAFQGGEVNFLDFLRSQLRPAGSR